MVQTRPSFSFPSSTPENEVRTTELTADLEPLCEDNKLDSQGLIPLPRCTSSLKEHPWWTALSQPFPLSCYILKHILRLCINLGAFIPWMTSMSTYIGRQRGRRTHKQSSVFRVCVLHPVQQMANLSLHEHLEFQHMDEHHKEKPQTHSLVWGPFPSSCLPRHEINAPKISLPCLHTARD